MKYTHILLVFILTISGAFAGPESACHFNKGNCPQKHGYVQDYGYGGLASNLRPALKAAVNPIGNLIDMSTKGITNPECIYNPTTPIYTGAATWWNGNANEASRAELEAIQCAGEQGNGYHLPGPAANELIKTAANLDELQEELVFLTATKNIHDFNECQNKIFRSFFDENRPVKRDMLTNAWTQFDDIRTKSNLLPQIREEYSLRAKVARASSITSCIKDSCRTPTTEEIGFIKDQKNNKEKVDSLRSEINLVISRIPMANRDSMREAMENLLMSPEDVTQARFEQVFENEMHKIDDSLQKSRDFIKSITVMNGDKQLFCVDRNLKENLYRSGQLDHTVHQMGLDDILTNFKLRSQNRYGLAGTVVTEVAMIPSYFVGYGAARLALRAGSSTVRAVSMGGRALAGATRGAMLGLEAADYGAAISGAMADCSSDDFMARVDGKSCDPSTEIGQVYEEASMAQCLTSSILPFASAFVGTGIRVVNSPRLRRLYNATSSGDEIIVTATKKTSKKTSTHNEPATNPKKLVNNNAPDSHKDLPAFKNVDRTFVEETDEYIKAFDGVPESARGNVKVGNLKHVKKELTSYLPEIERRRKYLISLRSGNYSKETLDALELAIKRTDELEAYVKNVLAGKTPLTQSEFLELAHRMSLVHRIEHKEGQQALEYGKWLKENRERKAKGLPELDSPESYKGDYAKYPTTEEGLLADLTEDVDLNTVKIPERELKQLQHMILMPTSKELSMEDMNYYSNHAVGFVGTIFEHVTADHRSFNPYYFFTHDLAHARLKSKDLRASEVMPKIFNNVPPKQMKLRQTLWFHYWHEKSGAGSVTEFKTYLERIKSDKYRKFKDKNDEFYNSEFDEIRRRMGDDDYGSDKELLRDFNTNLDETLDSLISDLGK